MRNNACFLDMKIDWKLHNMENQSIYFMSKLSSIDLRIVLDSIKWTVSLLWVVYRRHPGMYFRLTGQASIRGPVISGLLTFRLPLSRFSPQLRSTLILIQFGLNLLYVEFKSTIEPLSYVKRFSILPPFNHGDSKMTCGSTPLVITNVHVST